MPQDVIHIALSVRNLEESIAFYRTLLDVEPSKLRPQYAKLEPRDPALNLALREVPDGDPERGASHFGIEVSDTEAVQRAATRLRAAGLTLEGEQGVTCCYAVQDKVWVQDPDGNAWEVFTVLDPAPVQSEDGAPRAATADCC